MGTRIPSRKDHNRAGYFQSPHRQIYAGAHHFAPGGPPVRVANNVGTEFGAGIASLEVVRGEDEVEAGEGVFVAAVLIGDGAAADPFGVGGRFRSRSLQLHCSGHVFHGRLNHTVQHSGPYSYPVHLLRAMANKRGW